MNLLNGIWSKMNLKSLNAQKKKINVADKALKLLFVRKLKKTNYSLLDKLLIGKNYE